jgi:altronate hydrolase
VFVPNISVDNVGVAIDDLRAGEVVDADGTRLRITSDVPAGHKLALRTIASRSPVYKLGHTIGFAKHDISRGEHVHVHNLGLSTRRRTAATRPEPLHASEWVSKVRASRDHFLGYRRSDGSSGTRNYLGIVPSVNCASTVARLAAQAASAHVHDLAGLDGVIALNHDLGCAMAEGSRGDDILRRTLRGYATHPNLVAVLVISLGCEVNQPENFLRDDIENVSRIGIQESGGSSATVAAALEWVNEMAVRFRDLKRERLPLSELTLGLQCGGSDAASGVTANPTLGVASDLLVAAGGKVILGETPEIYGAEHLLCRRADSRGVAERVNELIEWWVEYAAANGAQLESNPSKGNRDGGITTIWEKSLGAILKGGTSPLRSVVDYAQPVTAAGLTFMDTPGYDPVSATGMVAGGANVMAFTTGRGSVFGSRPVPCLKISSTTRLFQRMPDDMDFDAGPALTRDVQVDYGSRLFERIVDMASGVASRSELIGFGAEEIVPWKIGAVL